MIQIEFNYNQQITIIQAQQNEQFKNVINSYSQKTLLNPDSLYFLVNGQQINKENTVESYMNQINKQNNKLIVLVNLIEEGNKSANYLTNREYFETLFKYFGFFFFLV